MPEALGDLAAGLALLIGGAAVWMRGGHRDSGGLMLVAGGTWFAGDVWGALLYAHRGPLVHLLLTYPSGRTRSPLIIALIGAAYIQGLVPSAARSAWGTIARLSAVAAAAAWRRRAAGSEERFARGVALAGAIGVGGTLALAATARLAGADADSAAVWAYEIAVAATAGALAAAQLWT